MGFGDPSRGRGRGAITSLPFLRFGVSRAPLWGISIVRGVLFPEQPTRPTSDAPVATPAPVFVGLASTPSRGPSRAGAAKDRPFIVA